MFIQKSKVLVFDGSVPSITTAQARPAGVEGTELRAERMWG
jgi:hypothetical protein